ncbi:MAG TPA: AraC family transcriptional regulator [Xanthobacteraceae bacterium]|nr:AraC family transcriptional regulator [Xanthobacteraceae bacterium]
MKKILFDSGSLAGDQRQRTAQWIDALSSGYVRLRADPIPETPFAGRLRIARLASASIGTIEGTVRNILRTAADVAIENTDNIVLLLNHDSQAIMIEQNGKAAECAPGGAVLIEQCEPSTIRVPAPNVCNIAAVQAPREQLRRECPNLMERLRAPIFSPSSALSLMSAYADFLLDLPDTADFPFLRLASEHVTGLIAAIVGADGDACEHVLPGLRAGRFATIARELDRHFTRADFSLTSLAQRLGVTPRYVQMLLSEADTSFVSELTRRRLNHARHMLTSLRYAHMSILDISQECGFSTVSHFHRSFRRHFDMTPGEMRAGTAT